MGPCVFTSALFVCPAWFVEWVVPAGCDAGCEADDGGGCVSAAVQLFDLSIVLGGDAEEFGAEDDQPQVHGWAQTGQHRSPWT